MSPPIRIQLAFQGGGARIALLLAAAEAICELEAEPNPLIEVSCIAGTSAGAIVGAFLAAGVPLSAVRTNLASDHGAALLGHFAVPQSKRAWAAAVWRCRGGKPLWDDVPLSRWLSEQFARTKQAKPSFEQLPKGRKLLIVSTNLESGGPHKHTSGDVITALLESAGLPLVFRSWSSGGNTMSVDGGLCENFPVDDLLANSSQDGPVLGFSFEEERPGRPSSFLAFAQALLGVSIGHSVALAQARLGAEAVYQLRSQGRITTFDFKQARAFLASEEYEKKKEEVKTWIRAWVANTRSKAGAHHTVDVWAQRESRDLESQMKKLGRVYRAQHQPQKFHYREVKLHAIANCLAEPGEPGHGQPDEVRYELTLEAEAGRPVFAHRLTLSSPVGRSFFGKYRIQLLDQHDASRAIEVLPSFDPENSMFREVVVFFSPPIEPGAGAYRLSIVDHGRDLFADLRPGGSRREWISVELGRALPEIGPVKFGLAVPERLRGVRVVDHETPGRTLAPGECASAFGLAPVGFETIGWEMRGREATPVVRADFIG